MSNKTDLIQLRISPEDKDIIKAEAARRGISMSQFIVLAAGSLARVTQHINTIQGDTHAGSEQKRTWSGRRSDDANIALDA